MKVVEECEGNKRSEVLEEDCLKEKNKSELDEMQEGEHSLVENIQVDEEWKNVETGSKS